MRRVLSFAIGVALLASASTALADREGPDPRIVGGEVVPPGAYPWTVALISAGEPADVGQLCGGSLVSPIMVLTAGHCVGGSAPNAFDVVVGRDRLSDSSAGQRIPVDRIAMHPELLDVALLRLSEPATPAPVTPASKAEAPLYSPGNIATVIGWGAMSENATFGSDELREVDVPIVSDRSCAEVYRQTAGFFDRPNSICAGAKGKDSCAGDSGGPLIVDNGSGSPLLVGVTSYGRGCGRKRYPGVYVEVPAVFGFVTDSDPVFAPVPDRRTARIEGDPVVGKKLTCVRGGWEGEDIKFRYYWYGGFSPRPLSRNRQFRPSEELAGLRIGCDVVGETAGGFVVISSVPVRVHGSGRD